MRVSRAHRLRASSPAGAVKRQLAWESYPSHNRDKLKRARSREMRTRGNRVEKPGVSVATGPRLPGPKLVTGQEGSPSTRPLGSLSSVAATNDSSAPRGFVGVSGTCLATRQWGERRLYFTTQQWGERGRKWEDTKQTRRRVSGRRITCGIAEQASSRQPRCFALARIQWGRSAGIRHTNSGNANELF